MALLSSGFRKVSGNLAGIGNALGGVTGASGVFTAPAFDLFSSGRNQTQHLQYPSNVESDPQQGHYIIFEILEQDKSKLAGSKVTAQAKSLAQSAASETGQKKTENAVSGSGGFDDMVGAAVKSGVSATKKGANAYMANVEGKYSGTNSLQVAQKATKKMKVHIALYMPPSVQVSYGAKYADQEIGVGAESINAGIRAFMNAEGSTLDRTAVGVGTGLAGVFNLQQGQRLLQKGLGKLPGMGGSEAVFAINRGSIITPRMELMFEGITRRDFSFNFSFLPKSEQEAETVEQIVKKFKYHMASNYGTGGMGGVDGVREMSIPDFFQISYMHMGGLNTHLNKIKQCVLQNASVEYGSDRYKAYEGGRPQTTKLSLSFQELEIITKDAIADGY